MNSQITVFVCGTYSDLSAERGDVLDAIQRLQLRHHSMEFFGARPERPIETCLSEVRDSDIIVVIVGRRYGSMVPGRDVSYSEAEYEEAHRLGKPCLVYFLNSDVDPDQDQSKVQLLMKWKALLQERHTPFPLRDRSKLPVQVAVDLVRELDRIASEKRKPSPLQGLAPSRVSLVNRWSKSFGDEARQLLHGLASDSQGNLIIVGDLWGSVNFGGQRLASKGDRDIFLAKFDRSGNHLWSMRFGDESEQVGNSVATDSAGAVFLGGSFKGSVDFGGGGLVSQGTYNVFLTKLDHRGRHVWSRRFGDKNYHVLEGLAVAPSGIVTIAGRFQGTIDFGTGQISSQSNQTDVFVASFTGQGECIWAKRFGGAFEQQTRSIAADQLGNIAIAGVFKGSVTFGGYVLAEQHPGDYCGFVAKLDENGEALWCKRLGDPHAEQGSVVAFDRSNGDLLVAGFIRNNLPSERSREILCFLARYDLSGVLEWSKAIQGVWCTSLDVAPGGRILFAGYFDKTVDFGLGTLVSAGGNDLTAALFSPDGRALWAERFGDPRQQFLVKGVHCYKGSIALAGSFHGTIDLGAGALVASGYDGTHEGAEDVFLSILQS